MAAYENRFVFIFLQKDKDVANGEITLMQEGSRVEYKFVNGKRVKDEMFNIN